MPELTPALRDRCVKLLWLAVDNENPHERAVAAAKLGELLKTNGLTPPDVLAPPPVVARPLVRQARNWRVVVEELLDHHPKALFARERDEFLPDLPQWGYAPKGGQIAWLRKICRRAGVAMWDGAA